jgi:hypothetical protein
MVPFPWPVHLHSVHDRHVGVERSNMIFFRRGSVDTRVGLDKVDVCNCIVQYIAGLLVYKCTSWTDISHISLMRIADAKFAEATHH